MPNAEDELLGIIEWLHSEPAFDWVVEGDDGGERRLAPKEVAAVIQEIRRRVS